ncbi:ATPase AAA [Candidatus Thiomargarita nelsonii]|uniref:ATPase AAA n=1 Tax=Candidatus Thiomargarita nelsonii TaxID=1003181 RepID=A0A0A6PRB5_9GAMM|nr:ATPase AAA [Candidatus Thiomargarita nelsonii]
MLTRIHIKNFKRFNEIEFELGKTVVLIGPNNSGKTTALQALALWEIGLKRCQTQKAVTINRRDLIATPVPSANLLWHDLAGQPPIEITVEATINGKNCLCGIEFDYANEESFYCRPTQAPIPPEAANMRVAFLPPMSGLAAIEPKWEPGRIHVLIGEGQTAQVLRNLCYHIEQYDPSKWLSLKENIKKLFGVTLLSPTYIRERGEITMAYQDLGGLKLDLSSSGRGLQQTLLLLAHLYANPDTVLLLDEPDAHLEILRQRQIYQLLTETAQTQGAQIIAASHSQVVLNEAADRDIVIAFVGKPHRIDGRVTQVIKSLTDLGFDQYYQAEQTGWVLYLEGSSDLAILQTFANTLEHPAAQLLERPFRHYVYLPQRARDHFFGLREAKPDLVGIAIFDRLTKILQKNSPLTEMMWQRREIENYLCQENVLLTYARDNEQIMHETIAEIAMALKTLGKPEPWSADIKASDDFLNPLFNRYFEKLGLQNFMYKTNYHVLARLVPKEKIAPEIIEKLDSIVAVAETATPR